MIWQRRAYPQPTEAFDTFWRFAAERQDIFFRRLAGQEPPWTTDPILEQYKFTNAYRASDRVSQFLIQHVIYSGAYDPDPKDLVFRILLFKIFNRIETWQRLEEELGQISFRTYEFDRYDSVLSRAMVQGERIYSAAYIMPPGRSQAATERKKHRFHLRLLEQIILDDVPQRLADTSFMGDAFTLLRTYSSIGSFLAYQFVTDINYSEMTSFTEKEFVMPGPGAIDGIRKCFRSLGSFDESDVIRFMADRQEVEFERLGLDFRTLWGRELQLIDVQNLFCEVGKYSRVRHPGLLGVSKRTRIKQHFEPQSAHLAVWYPPKWDINDRVAAPTLRYPADESDGLSQGSESR